MANHTRGGWMYYEYMGPGNTAGTNRYRITLKFYTSCILNTGQFDPTINFSVFNATSRQLLYTIPVTYSSQEDIQNCSTQECHPCISNIPTICYKITTYQTEQDMPSIPGGYVFSYQRCCRISAIVNLTTPSNNVGETWSVTIPGSAIPGAEFNSNSKFAQNDTAIICQHGFFTFDFSATDINDDSLVYNFTAAYAGGSTTTPSPSPASNPPYSTVSYQFPFSGLQPLGAAVSINHQTGIVSGIAPGSGIYVVTVVVSEYTRGTSIKKAEVRKSLHIQVADCNSTAPKLDPVYFSCDGFTENFVNQGDATNIVTYDWEFGDGSTSNQPAPIHTYADTGTYTLKLVVNRNLQCSDSANAQVKVYPGFFPGINVAGQCKNTLIQFTDLTTTVYGLVNSWSWNFGDPGSPNNTSAVKNPTHIYAASGNYPVQFIVGNSKGCIKTIDTTISILDKPSLAVTHDTLICVIDTLQLNAVGTGTFLWSPNYNINNVNIDNPLVSPDIPTTYHVTLTDPFGCVGTDSVKVDVKLFVTLFAPPDSTICKGDATVLRIVSDGLHYQWTEIPAGNTLNDPTIKNPIATPLVSTTYHVDANIGKCVSQANIKLTPIPYPPANAGPDIAICFGNSAQLQATGGSSYSWSPAAFLSATNIPNPRVQNPTASVRYIVTVRDILGCPKPARDTVLVNVIKIKAEAGPRDTSVVIGQPLQLQASGGTSYSWTPSTWLDNANIDNPIALPKDNIEYVVRVSNSIGCFSTDSIRVKLYKIAADILVPTGFSPNGDGINDVFRPIPIGMRSLDVFQVYNRWGQMLYSGTDAISGWDGTFLGKTQEAGTYVWFAEGIDYKNTRIKRKGYVVLVR